MESHSLLYPQIAPELYYVPYDLNVGNQPYMFPSDSTHHNRINATKAWDFTQGLPTQLVSLIDAGVYVDHEDFAGRIQGGFSYHPDYDYFEPAGFLDHGTATAGALAATGDTNYAGGDGMAGLNWKTKLYLIKVDSRPDSVVLNSIGDAIALSDSVGADPISLSVGWEMAGKIEAADLFGQPMSCQTFNTWLHDRTIVAAKGNEGINTYDMFAVPADLTTVIGVGSNNNFGLRYRDSNYGAGMKVLAPGVDIYSTWGDGGYIGGLTGTSMAAPLVAGTISLIKAANPKLLADEAEAILYLTARDVTSTGIGYDIHTGYGIIDAGDAVEMAATKVIYRDSSSSSSERYLSGFEDPWTFFDNHGYNGGLPSGTYNFVERYEVTHTFHFSFGHDSLYPVARLRSTMGWPANDDPDSTREVAWAGFKPGTLSRDSVIAYTAAYYVPGDGYNPDSVAGWWPCKNPPCVDDPDIDLQISILVGTLAGDANNNLTVNIADANYIINIVYNQGPSAPVADDADANGNCTVNIADAIYIVNLVFNQGPAPVDANCIDTSLKLTPGFNATDGEFVLTDEVSLFVAAKTSGAYPLKLDTKRNIHGIDITLKALGGSQVYVTNRREDMQLWWSQSGDIVRIGLMDTLGQGHVPTGIHDVVDVKGQFEVISVLGVETLADGTIETIKAPFVNGKNASTAGSILIVSFDGIEPNPFNPETKLSFSLPYEANVTIEIFNILGQRVTTVTDQRYDAGTHSVIWNSKSATGGGVSSGVYFARMTSGEFVSSKKMMILK